MKEILRTEAQIIKKKKSRRTKRKILGLKSSKITGWAQEQRGDDKAVSELKDNVNSKNEWVSECVGVYEVLGPCGIISKATSLKFYIQWKYCSGLKQRIFSDRRKPRELIANRPALKELLKKFSK